MGLRHLRRHRVSAAVLRGRPATWRMTWTSVVLRDARDAGALVPKLQELMQRYLGPEVAATNAYDP